jgi:hypothetical protein
MCGLARGKWPKQTAAPPKSASYALDPYILIWTGIHISVVISYLSSTVTSGVKSDTSKALHVSDAIFTPFLTVECIHGSCPRQFSLPLWGWIGGHLWFASIRVLDRLIASSLGMDGRWREPTFICRWLGRHVLLRVPG